MMMMSQPEDYSESSLTERSDFTAYTVSPIRCQTKLESLGLSRVPPRRRRSLFGMLTSVPMLAPLSSYNKSGTSRDFAAPKRGLSGKSCKTKECPGGMSDLSAASTATAAATSAGNKLGRLLPGRHRSLQEFTVLRKVDRAKTEGLPIPAELVPRREILKSSISARHLLSPRNQLTNAQKAISKLEKVSKSSSFLYPKPLDSVTDDSTNTVEKEDSLIPSASLTLPRHPSIRYVPSIGKELAAELQHKGELTTVEDSLGPVVDCNKSPEKSALGIFANVPPNELAIQKEEAEMDRMDKLSMPSKSVDKPSRSSKSMDKPSRSSKSLEPKQGCGLKAFLSKQEGLVKHEKKCSSVPCKTSGRVLHRKGSARYLAPVPKEFEDFHKIEDSDSGSLLGPTDSPRRKFLKTASNRYLNSPHKEFSSLKEAVKEFHKISAKSQSLPSRRHSVAASSRSEAHTHPSRRHSVAASSQSEAQDSSLQQQRAVVSRSASVPMDGTEENNTTTEVLRVASSSVSPAVSDSSSVTRISKSPRKPIFQQASAQYVATRRKKVSSTRKLPPPPFLSGDIFDDYEKISSMSLGKL